MRGHAAHSRRLLRMNYHILVEIGKRAVECRRMTPSIFVFMSREPKETLKLGVEQLSDMEIHSSDAEHSANNHSTHEEQGVVAGPDSRGLGAKVAEISRLTLTFGARGTKCPASLPANQARLL